MTAVFLEIQFCTFSGMHLSRTISENTIAEDERGRNGEEGAPGGRLYVPCDGYLGVFVLRKGFGKLLRLWGRSRVENLRFPPLTIHGTSDSLHSVLGAGTNTPGKIPPGGVFTFRRNKISK